MQANFILSVTENIQILSKIYELLMVCKNWNSSCIYYDQECPQHIEENNNLGGIMGKLVLIGVIVVASIVAVTLITVTDRSEELPETLSVNFKNLGSYALQYAVNQVVDQQVVGSTVQEFTGADEFIVLNGQINKIEYDFTYKNITVGTEEDAPVDSTEVVTLDFSGSLNINPDNGANEFSLETPEGVFDRWDLHSYNIDGYIGAASKVQLKPKALGVYLVINDEPVELSKSTYYTITSDNMNVRVFNDKIKKGKAMGKWWLDIAAVDAVIDPLPDGVDAGNFYIDDPEKLIVTQTYSLIKSVEINAEVSSFVNGKRFEHSSSCFLEADEEVDYEILDDGSVLVHNRVDVTFEAIGSSFSNSKNEVSMKYSVDNGVSYVDLWDGGYIAPGDSFTLFDVPSESTIILEANWYDYYYHQNKSQQSTSSWTDVYRDGDQTPSYIPAAGQEESEAFMAPYVNADGEVTLGMNETLFLFELGHVTKDYQDAVMLMRFAKIGDPDYIYMGDLDIDTDKFRVTYWKP